MIYSLRLVADYIIIHMIRPLNVPEKKLRHFERSQHFHLLQVKKSQLFFDILSQGVFTFSVPEYQSGDRKNINSEKYKFGVTIRRPFES